MKLKFYLRGIGLGIIVAVALCISAGMKNDQISDEEIIKRAEALGMVPSSETLNESVDEAIRDGLETEEMTENDASGDAAAVKVNEDIPATEPDETEVNPDEADNSNFDETPPAAGSDGAATPKVTPTLTKEVTPAPTKEPDKDTNDTENDTEYITVVVERGSGSDTVARKIEAAGLVANASEFDRYLCNNGYDKRISAGNHKIPINAREEEIAKILCNMQ
ncbi:hypothetical protein [Lacrimispora saccharolytica]|uniref:hypothetical protein n=1 Tax=Lacrimispora saccharolytica TaxID=84030 RepID=UPI00265D0F7F|nr:hypothetical protein [Lacrimispora saccharolytica]MBS7330120.1 hypothetical protein [Lachnospiraceae bacterium]MCF2655831.1 hypothetical protein [Lacrimispora saccharolytica]MDD7548733.1 hypothetical protein [Lachnospiraceae bacterium]MDY4126938.1 hypothetical protein [Lachnospiraceae bacterium]